MSDLFLAELASQALQKGDYSNASRLFQQVVQAHPEQQELRVGHALALYNGGDQSGAIQILREVLTRNPLLNSARNLLNAWSPEQFNQIPKVYEWAETSAAEYAAQNVSDCSVSEIGEFRNPQTGKAPRIYTLSNIAIIGTPAALLTKCGKVIHDSIAGFSQVQSVIEHLPEIQMRSPSVWPFKKLEGEFVVLTGFWSHGFYHWMTEWLPKVILAETSGFKGHYLVSESRPSFINESLKLCGISEDRIQSLGAEEIAVERLVVPEAFSQTELLSYPALMGELRERLLRGVSTKKSTKGKAIYITRRGANLQRQVINEPALCSQLKAHGIEAVEMDSLPIEEQIRVAREATFLTGPHGAGMVHALFMPKGSTVVEFFSPNYINPACLPIMDFMQHRYFMLPSFLNGGKYPHATEIEVNGYMLDVLLRKELAKD